jgi:Ca-activated chloride channel family protein
MKKTLLFILLCILPLVGQSQTPKSDKPFTVSVDVDLVLFNVTVLDRKGHLVPGLDQKNFKIYEDGKAQEIRVFHPEDVPATVGILIDSSGSMGPKISDVVNAATTFVEDSNPQDELFIVGFNDRVYMGLPSGVPFTNSRSELQHALNLIRASGRTALYDAVAFSLKQLQRGTLQKKALVLLSDGGDNASHIGVKDVIPMAEQSSATIYTIGFYDANDRDRNPKVLHELAKSTGGESYVPHSTYEMSEIWSRIAGGIRSQYTIGWLSTNPARDGTFRNVKVNVVDPKGKPLSVKTRSGYRASSGEKN